jgi:hypothetical protein
MKIKNKIKNDQLSKKKNERNEMDGVVLVFTHPQATKKQKHSMMAMREHTTTARTMPTQRVHNAHPMNLNRRPMHSKKKHSMMAMCEHTTTARTVPTQCVHNTCPMNLNGHPTHSQPTPQVHHTLAQI